MVVLNIHFGSASHGASLEENDQATQKDRWDGYRTYVDQPGWIRGLRNTTVWLISVAGHTGGH